MYGMPSLCAQGLFFFFFFVCLFVVLFFFFFFFFGGGFPQAKTITTATIIKPVEGGRKEWLRNTDNGDNTCLF